MWAPTLEFDGTKNWIQIGNVPWAAPGKNHDETRLGCTGFWG